MKDKELEEQVGRVHGATVLPENMKQWIDELYSRPVDKDEALDVADYLIAQERRKAFQKGYKVGLHEQHIKIALKEAELKEDKERKQ